MEDFALGTFLARWYPTMRHNLAASESETWRVPELLALASPDDLARWDDLGLGYTDPNGAEWLRTRIAEGYEQIDATHIIACAGAQEAFNLTLRALLTLDDHAIIILPAYQPCEMAMSNLCATTGIALDATQGWALDIDAIKAAIRPNTRLILINFPNNPTGKLIDADAFDALIALCREHGLWLINDEVYRLIDRDPTQRLPCVADAYELGISIDAVSKSMGLPGLRVGWLASKDKNLIAHVNSLKCRESLCLSAPSEVLAHIALGAADALLSRNREIARSNLEVLDAFMQDHADRVSWHRSEGGVVGYIRYHGDVETFATNLARDTGTLVLPASVWASRLAELPTDHFRVGFGKLSFTEGIARLSFALSQRLAA